MLSIVIQAGGESKRMGADKGLVLFLGQPLAARLAQRMAPIAGELLLTTNRPEAYAFVGLPMAQDIVAGRGALGGLYTALSSASGEFVGVVACDMPFACPELFAHLHAMLESSGADAAIPHPVDGWQPFHAVYRRATCLPAVEAALQAGLWRADAWYAQVQVLEVDAQELQRIGADDRCFLNVNTPEELANAEKLV
jgi:molybdopterin-guanine dinucleotide biosynthesis protein A